MKNKLQSILNFLNTTEGAKNELRHSWTSIGRQESVAEHSWRLALMVLVFSPYFPDSFDLLKALEMAVLHDIGEVSVGDLHFLEINKSEKSKQERSALEKASVLKLCNLLKKSNGEILRIWQEFEENKTLEAQVVNCLDKLEVCIQHNQAEISTWTEEEKKSISFYFSHITPPLLVLEELKKMIHEECVAKTNSLSC